MFRSLLIHSLIICLVDTLVPQLSLAQPSAQAQQFQVGTRITNYTNIFNAPTFKDTDTAVEVDAVTFFEKLDQFYNVRLAYDARQSTYLQDSFDDDRRLSGEGYLSIGDQSRPITWFIANREQVTWLDIISENTPNNRVQRSTFSTGPEMKLALSPRDILRLDLIYQSTNVERSVADSERSIAELSWEHSLSSIVQLTLYGSHNSIEPKRVLERDYKQNNLNFIVDRVLPSGRLTLDFGYATVDEFGSQEDLESETFEATLEQQIGLGALTFAASQEVSDSGSGTRGLLSFNDLGSIDFDIEKRQQYTLSYLTPSSTWRTRLRVELSQLKSESLTRQFEETGQRAQVSLHKKLQRRSSLVVALYYRDRASEEQSLRRSQFISNGSISYNRYFNESTQFECAIEGEKSSGGIEYEGQQFSCALRYNLL